VDSKGESTGLPSPLVGDPKREAADSGRGFIYQYWQTVWRWIRLEPNELLFIEKAADFDVVAQQAAEAVEVKDTVGSGPITLNSENVLRAISYFWELREKNREFKIDFRFLTTSGRGLEKSKDFGEEKGLDCWDRCKFDASQLGRLRAFLLAKSTFNPNLAGFIRNCSDRDFQEQLIRRINWETGNRSIDALKKLITEQVSCLGEAKGISRSLSVKVVPLLFQHVCDLVAGSKERRLHRDDFLQIFEKETILRGHQPGNQTAVEVGATRLHVPQVRASASFAARVKDSAPRMLTGLTRRAALVHETLPKLMVQGALVLKGSTGMGKSTLANLLVAKREGPCRWIDLRGLQGEEIRLVLHQETFLRNGSPAGVVHVLDDLNLGAGFAAYQNSLVDFWCSVLSQSGLVLITAQTELPADVLTQIGIGREVETQVPPLNETEIEEVAVNFGCSDEIQRRVWTLRIQARTRGHPQLVLAVVKGLQARRWPEPLGEASKKPIDLAAARRDARRLLRESLPSDSARTLAFRLSLLDGSFRRDHALSLATHPPAIQLPGEAFDLLVGPWIEQEDDTHFRISPLLQGAAREVWPEEEVLKLHRSIAQGVLECGELTFLEASVMLQHGLIAGAEGPVTAVGSRLAVLSQQGFQQIVPYFLWFIGMKLGTAERLFPLNPVVSGLLRRAQFELAYEVSPKRLAPLVALRWEEEITPTGQDELDTLNRLGFLTATLIRYEVPFPITVLVKRVAEAIPLLQSPQARQFFPANLPLPDGENLDMVEHLFSSVLMRCSDIFSVLDLFRSLLELQEPERNRLLSIFGKHERWATLIFGKVYLAEEAKAQPQWKLCVLCLKLMSAICSAWKIRSLTAACCSSIAVIYDEYLHDPAAATKAIEDGKRVLKREEPILESAHAMVLYREGKYASALTIFERILPSWHSKNAPVAFAFHKAEICAAKVGDWEKAAKLARSGQHEAEAQGLKNMALGFRADHAWALWKLGKREPSIKAFAEVLGLLPEKPDAAQDFRAFALYKQVGHTVGWLLQAVKESGPLVEPPPGWFSLADVDERIKEHPLQSLDCAWFVLAQLEIEVTEHDGAFKVLERRAAKTSIEAIRFGFEHLRLRRKLRKLRLSSLVKDYVIAVERFELALKNYAQDFAAFSGRPDDLPLASLTVSKFDHSGLLDLLFAATLLVRCRGGLKIPLSQWQADISSHEIWRNSTEVRQWMDFVSQSSPVNIRELKASVVNSNRSIWTVGALFLSLREDVQVEDRLIGNMILVASAGASNWRREVESEIERVVVGGWSRIASPSQRFNLVSPAANAPRILEAAAAQTSGLKKAAQVLLAAKDAVAVVVPANLIQDIRNLAGS